MTPMPSLEYVPGACPQCGATTAEEAGPICTATQGMDGDYHCAGSEKEDDQGRFLYPTPESLARLEAWYAADARFQDLAEKVPLFMGIDMGAGDDMTHEVLVPPVGLEPNISGSTIQRPDLWTKAAEEK